MCNYNKPSDFQISDSSTSSRWNIHQLRGCTFSPVALCIPLVSFPLPALLLPSHLLHRSSAAQRMKNSFTKNPPSLSGLSSELYAGCLHPAGVAHALTLFSTTPVEEAEDPSQLASLLPRPLLVPPVGSAMLVLGAVQSWPQQATHRARCFWRGLQSLSSHLSPLQTQFISLDAPEPPALEPEECFATRLLCFSPSPILSKANKLAIYP